jgi:hypothetical protein
MVYEGQFDEDKGVTSSMAQSHVFSWLPLIFTEQLACVAK